MSNKNFGFDALVDEQTSPEVTINNALDRIAAGVSDQLSVNLSAGNVSLTDTQYTSYYIFSCTGHTVARDLTVPLEIDTGIDSPRVFVVLNTAVVAAAIVTVKGASGTTVRVLPGTRAVIASDGVNLILLGNNSWAVGFSFPGLPGASEILAKVLITDYVLLLDDLVGSRGHAGTAPADGNYDIDVQVNGVSIGTITLTVTTGAFTFATATSTALVPGDRIEFIGDSVADSALADVSLTIKGFKVG